MAQAGNNMIVGVDTTNARVKVMTIPGMTVSRAEIEYYDFDRKLMDAGDYVSILDSVFASMDANVFAQNAVSLVLPNTLVGFDFV